ncbi:tubulin-like doman-containing protein [Gloeocapsa sp. PCC 73106]|uniref:tubulin-like doman-containing protein n=1 Tax=Gloeocapsa sp. PCC 73106 TaxID=102232 RepID=UPI0002ACA1ED|nr:tubulin-like doman-containing protein [Gloeocapsa sp. PCC 73106]ELS00025.1 hypothetical protein GLO73106DRAFT_00038780 [Gloeocapsa sp. PCC 73106]
MAQATSNERQKQSIKRTICIGLGGTGRDVLMRIRRLIVERHGNLSELPLVGFVHIDTEKGARQVSSLRGGSIYHGVDLSFSDAETVAATMNTIEINTLLQGLKQRQKDDRPGPYDHIQRWFPPQLLNNLKAVEDGAKGIRPVGRLAFFHNYRKIQAAIEQAENRTRGYEDRLLKKGWVVEPGLDIFVVGSLCGGTGSGIFLDVAYHLRRFYGDAGAQISAYLVISPEIYGGAPNMCANTYAALKELNYHTTPGIKFEACYDPQNLAYVQESRPPFEWVYLVSNQTASNYKIGSKDKLANVIAYKIFLEFSGEVAPLLRAQKDNYLKHMLTLDLHPSPNVQRYLCFGLASIYLPRDISVAIALNRISIKLLDFWFEGEGQSPDAQELLNRFLLQWNPGQGNPDYLSAKLKEATQDNGRTFVETLNSWKNRLQNSLENSGTKEEKLAIRGQLSPKIREQFRKVLPGESESTRGTWLTLLQQVRSRVTEGLKQDIQSFFQDLLQPTHPNFSLQSARRWLEALITELNKQQRNLEDKIQHQDSMYTLDSLENKLKNNEQMLEDLENKRGLLGFGKKQNQAEFQTTANDSISSAYQLSLHNFEAGVTQEALEITKNLQEYVQNLKAQANAFNLLCKNIQSFYINQQDEIKNLNDSDMNGQAIFADDDTEEYYQMLLPKIEQRSELAVVTTAITAEVALGDSLADFCKSDRLVEGEELKKQISATIDRIFGNRGLNLVDSAVKRFMRSYPSLSDRSIRLEQITNEAQPLLPLNFADPYFYNDPGKTLQLIAFRDSEEPEVRQLKDILINNLGITNDVLKPIQAEDEILIINEYGAFPMRLINNLEQLRQHYERQKNQQLAFLHNDYTNAFTDIIPPSASVIEQIQDVFYPCLAFQLLQYKPETKTFQFEYFNYIRGTIETAALSWIWIEAIETLSHQREMVQKLEELLNNMITEIKNHPHPLSFWENTYLNNYFYPFKRQVDDLPQEHPNYLYREQVIGKDAEGNNFRQQGIMDRFKQRIERELSELHLLPAQQQSPQNTLPIDAEYTEVPQSLMQKLERLVEMREKGYLSETQFENAKKQLGL